MFLTKIKIVTTTMLVAVMCNGACLTGYSSMPAGQSLCDEVKNFSETTVTMFPDGLDHDFGKVTRGTQCNIAFRVINTSKVPLRISSLRMS
jgi:hypothetical protein